MAGVPDQERNVPLNQVDKNVPEIGGSEEEKAHRRMEHNADKMANRANERMKRDEAGSDEFSNIGPI